MSRDKRRWAWCVVDVVVDDPMVLDPVKVALAVHHREDGHLLRSGVSGFLRWYFPEGESPRPLPPSRWPVQWDVEGNTVHLGMAVECKKNTDGAAIRAGAELFVAHTLEQVLLHGQGSDTLSVFAAVAGAKLYRRDLAAADPRAAEVFGQMSYAHHGPRAVGGKRFTIDISLNPASGGAALKALADAAKARRGRQEGWEVKISPDRLSYEIRIPAGNRLAATAKEDALAWLADVGNAVGVVVRTADARLHGNFALIDTSAVRRERHAGPLPPRSRGVDIVAGIPEGRYAGR